MCRYAAWLKEFGKDEDKENYNLLSPFRKHIHMCVILFSLFSWTFIQAQFVESIIWMLVLDILKGLFDVCIILRLTWGLWHICSQLQVWFGHLELKMFETEFKFFLVCVCSS
jgi:hypothetical protein